MRVAGDECGWDRVYRLRGVSRGLRVKGAGADEQVMGDIGETAVGVGYGLS